jgi:hypothetical protein
LTAGVAICDPGDDDVIHLDDEVILLVLACLAVSDRCFLEVCTGRARLHEQRRGFVDLVDDGEILERRLAGTSSAPCGGSTSVRHTP